MMPAPGDQHRAAGPQNTVMSNAGGNITSNPFEDSQRRISVYTAQEIASLQARLDKKLGPEYISSRPGAAGQKVHYLSADKCINLANEVFGFNGWSSSIQNIQIDFVEEAPNTGKISLGLSVIVRVTLKDGTYHEDIGYGHIENCKGKAAAFEKAKKEGTTDALKRTLRNFGNVLGNCIYDKEYVAKVTKVKALPSKWDVDNLHRHPDFAPVKKEPQPIQKMEDDDLPPAVAVVGRNSNANSNMDVDGEFGSDVFDEADFGVTGSGNPDEVEVDLDAANKQPPTPMHGQQWHRGPPDNMLRTQGRPNHAVVTPSKPERFPHGVPAARPPNAVPQPNPSAPRHNSVAPSEQSIPPNRAMTATAPRLVHPNNQTPRVPQGQQRPAYEPTAQGLGPQGIVKREPGLDAGDHSGRASLPPEMPPPSGSPAVPIPATGFFSARAVDILRENPQAAQSAAPQFDPHAESPSIRKTAGVDHTKSVPITKPMLSGGTNPPPQTRDFVNPTTDMHRKIGAPGPGPVGSPMSRGPSTSSYRPLTRPSVEPKNLPANVNAVSAVASANRSAPGAANLNGKRPPLSDLTNANATAGFGGAGALLSATSDPKRPRVDPGVSYAGPQHQQQQPDQQNSVPPP